MNNSCIDWCLAHPAEAARLMGYEVEYCSTCVRSGETVTSSTICCFCEKGDPPTNWEPEEANMDKQKPRFTEEEVADARAILRLIPTAVYVKRKDYGDLLVAFIATRGIEMVRIAHDLFPSTPPGTSVSLKEIIGET